MGMSPRPSPTSMPSGSLIHPAVWPQHIFAKYWGLRPLFGMGIWVPITQCDGDQGLPAYQVSSLSVKPFGQNTPTLQTGQTGLHRTDNGPIGSGEPFYKRSPRKCWNRISSCWTRLQNAKSNVTDVTSNEFCWRLQLSSTITTQNFLSRMQFLTRTVSVRNKTCK